MVEIDLTLEKIEGKGYHGGLMFILDSPNKSLWKNQAHLLGMEKKLIDSILSQAGWDPKKTYYTYAVPVLREKLSVMDAQDWGDWLREEVRKVRPQKIISLGAWGYSILINRCDKTYDSPAKITHVRGRMEMTEIEGIEKPIPLVATVPQYFCLGQDTSWFRDFSQDIYKAISLDGPDAGAFPQNKIIICKTSGELKVHLNKLKKAPVISLDIETGGLNFKQHKIEAIGFAALRKDRLGATCVIIPHNLLFTKDASEYDKTRRIVKQFIQGETYSGTIAMHNMKFDTKYISEWLNISITNQNIRDTLIMNYLLDERHINHRTSPHSLKSLSRVRYDAFDYEFDWKTFWLNEVWDRDWQPLFKYLGLDLYYTLRLYYDLKKEIDETMPAAKFVLEKILVPGMLALTDVERRGCPVDVKYFQQVYKEMQPELMHLMQAMQDLLEDEAELYGEFNPNSPKQVAAAIFDHLEIPTFGKRTTSKHHLEDILFRTKATQEKYRAGRKFIELLLDYRKLQKTLSTYIKPLKAQANQGMIHGQYNLAGTDTGRLSAEKPNLQNVPQMTGPIVRRGFHPEPEHVWMKADYSQLELRVAAHLSKDPNMLRAFRLGRDIHNEVASAMFGISPEEVTKAQRYAAKFVDFGILYGRGAASLAYGPELREYNWSKQQAQKFIDNYLGEFSALRRWMYDTRDRAVKEQELSTPTGRKRRWPLILPETRHEVERQALNFPIQSTASDITLHALSQIFFWLKENKMKSRIVLTVHDEIDLIVPWQELDEVAEAVIDIMENQLPIELDVPIKADVEIGKNWTDLKPWVKGELPDWLQLL